MYAMANLLWVHTSCGDLSGSDMHPAHLTILVGLLSPTSDLLPCHQIDQKLLNSVLPLISHRAPRPPIRSEVE